MKIPQSHPRYRSLIIRQKLEGGVKDGITSLNGLIAHGRGEAFDYLLGEKTHDFAKSATKEAALLFVNATHPVISVNGNTAVLVTRELIGLAAVLRAPLEINLFHSSESRLSKTKKFLQLHGAATILLPDKTCIMPFLESERKYVHPRGIAISDVVFVPLEDGDRTEALIKNGKKVITVDLNPLSRTAQKATVTIVDNIIRALPLLILEIKRIQKAQSKQRSVPYSNKKILSEAVNTLRKTV